jgi:uncharacterized protein with GYD domain
MPTYVCLMTLTDKGVTRMKHAPSEIEQSVMALEAGGGKLIGFYATMGAYDYVAISECPNDEVAMSYLMGLAAPGDVRTLTMKAFNFEELKEMVKQLPTPYSL